MALETPTFINGLDPNNPASGDFKRFGDDHIRNLKAAIKASFPNITGAMLKSHAELNAMPSTAQQVFDLMGYVPYSKAGGLISGNVSVAGSINATGNIIGVSDERTKEDWKPLSPRVIELMAALLSGTYTDIESGERRVGVGAQSLEIFLPEAVVTDAEGTKGVAYGNASLAIISTLCQRVLDLESRLEKGGL